MLAAVGSFILLKIVDVVVGLRVSEADEYEGLDLTQHGESGYHLEEEFPGTVVSDTPAAPAAEHAAAVAATSPARRVTA